jgi:PII-like signaling protein
VSTAALKLTTYFGEHDRADGRFLADALLDVCERHGLRLSVLLRGAEGFGARHRLQTERLLTLSEDLPVVGVAVDTRDRVEAALPDVVSIFGHGLITLERARLVTGPEAADALPGSVKLTVYTGRREPPGVAGIVSELHACGLDGATVLLGVDGTVDGARRRARFLARNVDVPVMIVAVGEAERVLLALERLRGRLMTVERVTVCKRGGALLAPPPPVSEPGVWQKLMVHAGEGARFDGHPLHVALIRRLREAGAAGATALRGVWGFSGAEAPHGDRFWSLRRHVPVVTVVVDEPARVARWFEVVDEVTASVGLVTAELVPAWRATGPGLSVGALRLR